MGRPRMRPRFEIALPVPGGRVVDALRARLAAGGGPAGGQVFRRHAQLWIREEDQHYWSPQLSVEVGETDEPDAPILRGQFAPHPHVWTLFMAIYGVLAMAGTGGLMYGTSQWMLDQTPWALAAAPAAIALFLFVYGAAFIGQGLGSEQMYELRRFVDEAVEEAGEE